MYSSFFHQHMQMSGIHSSLNKSHYPPPVEKEQGNLHSTEAAEEGTCCLCTTGYICSYFYQVNSTY